MALEQPPDRLRDGIVDQDEVNAVLPDHWAHSPGIYMDNLLLLDDG